MKFIIAGCQGQSRDIASIQAIMNDLNSGDFRPNSDWASAEDVDLEAYVGNLKVILGNFADSILISISRTGNYPDRTGSSFGEFGKRDFLYYDSEWDFADYKRYVVEHTSEEALDAFLALLTLIETDFDELFYVGHKTDAKLEISGPIVTVFGNAATWTKGYWSKELVAMGDDLWELDVSLAIKVDFKRHPGSDWKISHIHLEWQKNWIMK